MRTVILILMCSTLITNLFAQNDVTIELKTPSKDRGLTVISALSQRASAREFDTTKISIQDLSDLLWAANGINRPETGMRTAPSALNAQDIDIFIFMETGTYTYNAHKHSLEMVVRGDNRKLFSRLETDIHPPLVLLLVSDISRFRRGEQVQKIEWAAIDAGIVAQNILLFCTSIEMVGRPKTGMNKEIIREFLKLNETQYPMLNIPVSYKKK